MMARKRLIQALCNRPGSYIATMGRRDGQKLEGRMKTAIPPLVDHRNYRRKRSCDWRPSDRSRMRLPRPRLYGEAARWQVRPEQGRSMMHCNNMGLSPHSWGLERLWGSRMPRLTAWFQRVRGPKRAVTMTCRTNKHANKRLSSRRTGIP